MSNWNERSKWTHPALGFSCLLMLGLSHSAIAATLCVNPAGSSGCYTTIGAAVSAASANDQISVGAGDYTESVTVNKPITLLGTGGASATIIDAHGLSNGIYVDGVDNGGLTDVTISGFTIENANFEGILVTNSSYIVITNNHVTNNDQGLNYAAGTCPGEPAFETNEGDDCGEGIHLMGVSYAMVANNVSDLNSGGILLSDETGQTYENMITSNTVRDNALDCGITLASHPPSPQASSKVPYGVFNNNIVGNQVIGNGGIGQGAGVGIFAAGPGNLAYGNKVIGNTIENNGLPGVTVHNHAAPPGAPGINLNGIVVMHNVISGNGADTEDATTPGTAGINIYSVAPVYATEILENTITNEDLDVVMNNPGAMDLHLNNLLGTGVGVANLGQGSVNASLNFFGCSGGPGTAGCTTLMGSSISATPFSPGSIGSAAPPAGSSPLP
jgi:nitrous oxidase accessory protein NosD